MIKHIEKSIKAAALTVRAVGITISIFIGIILLFIALLGGSGTAIFAIILIPFFVIFGIVLSFFWFLLIYGFGELIETQKEILKIAKETQKHQI